MRTLPFRRARFAAAALVTVLLPVCRAAAPAEEGRTPPSADAEAIAEQRRAAREHLPPELRMVLEKLDKANAELQDVTARVTYERAIPLLDEKEKSKGSLIFKKPGCIALKLGKPRNEEVYTNGKQWWVVSHDDKQVEIYTAADRGQGSQESAFLDFGYGTGSDKLLDDYEVVLTSKEQLSHDDEEETLYHLKFTPRERPDRPARYAAIEAVISDTLWLPQVLVLHESGGEIVHTYTLRRTRTNTEVEEDVFEYSPPRGYTVLRPEEL